MRKTISLNDRFLKMSALKTDHIRASVVVSLRRIRFRLGQVVVATSVALELGHARMAIAKSYLS